MESHLDILRLPDAAEHTSFSSEKASELLQKYQIRVLQLEQQIEELRKSNLEMEMSRNKYAFLYDVAPIGYVTLDPAGCIKSANLTGATLLGMERSSLYGMRFEPFVSAEDRASFAGFLKTVFSCRDKKTCRLKLANSSGPSLYLRIDMMASESGDECHAALLDITERKWAEEALRESEYNLTKAQAMSHVGSWSSNPVSGYLGVSDELLRIMRLKRDEATQEMFAALIHPDDRETVMRYLRRGIEQGINYEIEHRLLLQDGSMKWVYTIVEPSVNFARQVVRLYGTTQDITERKQSEVKLRNKKNELQAIFDSVNDGVIVFDNDGHIQHHNHICPQFFPETVLMDGTCRDIFHHGILHSPHTCPVERALAGERVETSLVYALEGHETRYIDVTANPIKDSLGEKTRALVFLRDVTLKRVQELQMIQTEKMSSIGVLATGVAHEINNPLTSVAGYAEALLRRFSDDPTLGVDPRLDAFQKYLEVIVRESYHCKSIIDSLLNFGRKSDGLIGNVDLNSILMEILELLRHQTYDDQIDLVVDLQDNLPSLLGDPSGLRQVFMNLLINAHHAIKKGGQVSISTQYNREEARVYVEVSDTGSGIDPDIIDRIWDPFFTTKATGKGLGLGLALTFNIVKRHGGEISVQSTVGKGSQFIVWLPVRCVNDSAATPPLPPVTRGT
ncbi:MAG TPA: PAS domain S-box protein [Desulfuromonadales bacterium]|nr:PAS domain S-box protein [Desulfuromonadales bacterium]